jgi:hypothetical protein
MKTHNVRWAVSLSNGDTVYEEKGDYQTIDNELSPWQRLVKFIEENKLHITSLALYTEDGRRFNLPSAGNNPRFKAFDESKKPIIYKMFRRIGFDVIGKDQKEEIFTIAQAEYEDGVKLQVWVDEQNFNSWTLVT